MYDDEESFLLNTYYRGLVDSVSFPEYIIYHITYIQIFANIELIVNLPKLANVVPNRFVISLSRFVLLLNPDSFCHCPLFERDRKTVGVNMAEEMNGLINAQLHNSSTDQLHQSLRLLAEKVFPNIN